MDVALNATAMMGMELFGNLCAVASRTENIFISTYSVLSALSMLLLGLRGESEKEFLSLLKIESDGLDSYHEGMSALTKELSSPSLSSANRLFVQRSFPLLPPFLENSTRLYSSAAETVDFAGSPTATQARINEWVKANTGEKIPEFLNSPLDSDTVVFLLNAIYFKADWLYPFKPELTQPGTFHVSANEKVRCDMMKLVHNTDKIRHGRSQELESQLIELPYDGDFSMLIILPNSAESLPEIERKLDGSLLRDELKKLPEPWGRGPHVYLPKFKIESTANLENSLKALGVTSVFDAEKADLSGMIDGRVMVAVSKIIHKAVIEVNEKGTEAAAATGVGISARCSPPTFRMDRPFLFTIVHRPTSTPIFVGRLSKPI